jgi:hypothetical protein
MTLFSWLRNRLATPAPQPRREAVWFRPQLETLERRDLPSTLTVTSAADSGPGSLRADIAAAQPNDTIVFAPSLNGQTIKLTSGELSIAKGLTIQGPGANQLTINGNNWRAFEVNANQPVVLSGLTLEGRGDGSSSSPYGGAIFNHTALMINGCVIANSVAPIGGGIYNIGTLAVNDSSFFGDTASGSNGGGISNRGTLTVNGSTFYHDVAYGSGGGVDNGVRATASLTNCTLCGNYSMTTLPMGSLAIGGGGLYAELGSTTTLTNCTVSLNTAKSRGGGIEVNSGGTLNLINTIVAGNNGGGLTGTDIYGAVVTADHNLIGNGAGSSGLVNGINGNLVGGNGNPVINPDLGPLQNNGGPTETMALLDGSPAIGQADNSKAPATDQRGVTRLDEAGETTDMGAFEL